MGVKRYRGVIEAIVFKAPAPALLSLFSQIGQAAAETGLPHSPCSEALEQQGAWWGALDSGGAASQPSHQRVQCYTERTGLPHMYMH